MAFDIYGNWSSPFYPIEDRDNDIPILASKFDEFIQSNVKSSFELCLIRNGNNVPISNMNWGFKRLTNLGDGVSENDAINLSQAKTLFSTQATETKYGVAQIASLADAVAGVNDTKIMTPYKVAQVLSLQSAYPPGFLYGLETSNDISNPDEVIVFGTGYCRNEDNTLNINALESFSKSIILDWEAGDGVGGKPASITFNPGDTVHCFTIGGGIQVATSGTLTTADISANVVNFQVITDGYLTYQVDGGVLQTASNLDFSLASSLADIALLLDNRIDGVIVANVGNTIVFTSESTGSSSSFKIFSLTSTGTNLYGSSYLDGSNCAEVIGEDEQAGAVDFGFDNVIDASNLLADPDVIAGGFTTYKEVMAYVLDGTGDIIPMKLKGDYAEYVTQITEYTLGAQTGATLRDFTVPTGIQVEVDLFIISVGGTGTSCAIYSDDVNAKTRTYGTSDYVTSDGAPASVITNTSGQLYTSTSNSDGYGFHSIINRGFTFRRGRI